MKLGIFGGTFNPIHKGHIEASLKFYDSIGLDKMLVIPNGVPPHKPHSLASGEHRLCMARIAYDESEITNGRSIEVSDIELLNSGKSYTINTIKALKSIYRNADFYMYLGSDAYLRAEKWYMGGEILKTCHMVTIARDKVHRKEIESAAKQYYEKYGCESTVVDYAPVEVSSAEIRNAIKNEYYRNLEAFSDFTKKYLTERVYRYIIKNSLYLNDDE